MFLKSIYLRNLKRFDELKIDFPDDITIVKGPNEKGKSTLVSAITAGLFFDPKKKNREIEELRSWHAPDKLYEIKVEFEEGGENYFLTKDFERRKILLENQTTWEKTENFSEISEKLRRFGGYRNAKLFESTSCVKQDQIASLSSEKKELSSALEDLIGGGFGSRGFGEIISKLEKIVADMNRGRGDAGWRTKNPGIIRVFEDKIRQNEENRRLAEESFMEMDKAWINFWKIEGELEKIVHEIELKKKEFENIKAYSETKKEIVAVNIDLETISGDLQEIETIRKKMAQLDQYLEKLEPYRSIDYNEFLNIFHSVQVRESRFNSLRERIKEMENSAGVSTKADKGIGGLRPIWFYLMFLLTVFGAAGFWFSPWFFLMWAIEGVLLFWLAFTQKAVQKVTDSELKNQAIELEKELRDIKTNLAKRFEALNVESLEDLEEAKQYLAQFEKEKHLLGSKIEGILRGQNIEYLKTKQRELASKLLVGEAKIRELNFVDEPKNQDYIVLERDLNQLAEAKENLQKTIAEAKAIISQTKITQDDIYNLDAEKNQLKKKLKKIIEKEKIYQTTAEVLLKAKQETEKNSRGIIEKFMQEFLEEITDGRYQKISIGDDWTLKVLSPDKGEEILPDGHLSRGTIDQFYLVARFAFLKLLFPDSRPLIILDDPFQSFDKKRRIRTRNILKELAHEFQILLFTHSDDYDNWGTVKRL